jgi:hypothetical protein
MKTLLFLIVSGLSVCSFAQNPQLPPGTKPGQLPAPKLQPLPKADLLVTAINFVSTTNGSGHKLVTMSVTIKNDGGMRTPITKLKGENAWARDGRPDGWKRMNESIDVQAIDPGASVTMECTFRVDIVTASKKFAIRVLVDVSGIVAEANESNNRSNHIIITP